MAKIALLSNMMEFNPGYSLTGIIKDQARMLQEYGHEVHLFVNSAYHGESFSENVILHKSVPFAHLKDYHRRAQITEEHKEIVKQTAYQSRGQYNVCLRTCPFAQIGTFSGSKSDSTQDVLIHLRLLSVGENHTPSGKTREFLPSEKYS